MQNLINLLVPWLSIIILPVVVGIIVSLDVAGLTLAQIRSFAFEGRSKLLWAIYNAAWHGGLLIVYLFAISGIYTFSFFFLDALQKQLILLINSFDSILLAEFIPYIYLVGDQLREHANIILAIITISIVWSTYSNKIISRPEISSENNLPPVARLIHSLVAIVGVGVNLIIKCINGSPRPVARLIHSLVTVIGRGVSLITRSFNRTPRPTSNKFWLNEFLTRQTQAALVAIDMLALAALINFMKYAEGYDQKLRLIYIVIGVVFSVTLAVSYFGEKRYLTLVSKGSETGSTSENIRIWLQITLRMIEPLLIFYFVLGLLAYLIFGQQIHSVGFIAGAILLLVSLIKRHGLEKIVESTLAEPIQISPDPASMISRFKSTLYDAWNLLKIILKCLFYPLGIFILLVLVAKYHALISDTPSLDFNISILCATTCGIIAGIYKLNHITRLELSLSLKNLILDSFITIHGARSIYSFALAALAVAAFAPLLDHLVSGSIRIAENGSVIKDLNMEFISNQKHAFQIGIWLIFLIFTAYIIDILKWYHVRKIDNFESKYLTNRDYFSDFIPTILSIYSAMFFAMGYIQLYISPLND